MRWMMVMALVLGACGSDRDGDGFDAEFDCDDRNADINPEAIEVCDGVDNNCNGTFGALACNEDPNCDEPDASDSELWFADFDDDGFGDPNLAAKACEQPIGWVENGDDCDDEDDSVGDICG
ncbi:MAG: hypothetical protein ACJATT_001222 [Myxococcota bacterium]|jgi:hypothetical protein